MSVIPTAALQVFSRRRHRQILNIMSTQTMTEETRHSQPHLSIDWQSQKRNSTGIDWFFETSNSATKRRTHGICPLTPVAEGISSTPSTSYFDHIPQASEGHKRQRSHSASSLASISEGNGSRPRARSFKMEELSRVDTAASTESQRKRRSSWTRKLSWVPGWTFAGSPSEEAIDDTVYHSVDNPALVERRQSRLGSISGNVSRRLSSLSQGIAEFQAAVNEPSHEKNFPAPIHFPEGAGRPTTIPVYGTVDGLSQASMRVLSPCGAKRVDFTDKENASDELLVQHFCSKLKDGDMLCEDPKLGQGSKLAIVLRGDMQDFAFKCTVVGLFPMRLLGSEKDLPEPYMMDVIIC